MAGLQKLPSRESDDLSLLSGELPLPLTEKEGVIAGGILHAAALVGNEINKVR